MMKKLNCNVILLYTRIYVYNLNIKMYILYNIPICNDTLVVSYLRLIMSRSIHTIFFFFLLGIGFKYVFTNFIITLLHITYIQIVI